MIVENLRSFVGALRQAVDTLPEAATVDMRSVTRPECDTPGCHAGIVMFALNILGVPGPNGTEHYSFSGQAGRLSAYLLPDMPPGEDYDLLPIEVWAMENPDIWGGPDGNRMFACPTAFKQKSDKFPSRVIADWWAAVLARLEDKP